MLRNADFHETPGNQPGVFFWRGTVGFAGPGWPWRHPCQHRKTAVLAAGGASGSERVVR